MPWTRRLQYVGCLLLLCSAFGPTFVVRAHPGNPQRIGRYEIAAGTFTVDGRQIPSRELGRAIETSVRGRGRIGPLWRARAWYPFLLVPVWLLALLLTPPPGSRALRLPRVLVGGALTSLAVGIAAFEALYLRADYEPFLRARWGAIETLLVWFAILVMLFYRRRGDRRLDAVEAAIAGQALLALAHFLTLPATMARPWIGVHSWSAMGEAVFANFPPLFWIACAGALIIALPVYLGPRRPIEDGLPVGSPSSASVGAG